jgi:hypothetical protein
VENSVHIDQKKKEGKGKVHHRTGHEGLEEE